MNGSNKANELAIHLPSWNT